MHINKIELILLKSSTPTFSCDIIELELGLSFDSILFLLFLWVGW